MLGFGSGHFGVAVVEAAPACVVAQRWVDDNIDNLPRSYDDVSQFDIAHRKAIFRALPSSDRIALWETHLDRFESLHTELFDDQRLFLGEMRSILPTAMSLSKDEILVHAQRAKDILGFDLAKAAFVTLGTPVVVEPEYASLNPDCDCDDGGSGWCGINFDCDGGAICDPRLWGCGFFGVEACLGRCVWNP